MSSRTNIRYLNWHNKTQQKLRRFLQFIKSKDPSSGLSPIHSQWTPLPQRLLPRNDKELLCFIERLILWHLQENEPKKLTEKTFSNILWITTIIFQKHFNCRNNSLFIKIQHWGFLVLLLLSLVLCEISSEALTYYFTEISFATVLL